VVNDTHELLLLDPLTLGVFVRLLKRHTWVIQVWAEVDQRLHAILRLVEMVDKFLVI
jgi:hypothetical protein